ncbi:ribonuclease HII [Anaerolineales bacterium HSG24]|nr:ribonuclease HII [Anaerolineales bacterium HSG24]
MAPHLEKEIALLRQGYSVIAGIDEAGRGAWAGPVVAAAVVLPAEHVDMATQLRGLDDSKKLSATQRDQFFDLIHHVAVDSATCAVSPERIDEINILAATRQAMQQSIKSLTTLPDYLLIDYVRLPRLNIHQDAFAKADQISLSVASASVLAKVTRDRLMVDLAKQYPQYGFERHKGYGTKQHQAALQQYGSTPIHRLTFKPLRALSNRLI